LFQQTAKIVRGDLRYQIRVERLGYVPVSVENVKRQQVELRGIKKIARQLREIAGRLGRRDATDRIRPRLDAAAMSDMQQELALREPLLRGNAVGVRLGVRQHRHV